MERNETGVVESKKGNTTRERTTREWGRSGIGPRDSPAALSVTSALGGTLAVCLLIQWTADGATLAREASTSACTGTIGISITRPIALSSSL